MDFPDHPFWDFSLALYGAPGVQEACLRLQDGPGLDVNLVLFACWTAAQGGHPSSADWRRLVDGSAAWRRRVVEPLREIRRFLKTGTEIPQAGGLRDRTLALELDAEHAAQLAIAALAGPPRGGGPADALAALLDYAAAEGAALSDSDRADLAFIAQRAGTQADKM